MKRVQLAVQPVDTPLHPGYALSAGGAEYLSTVELINWNTTNTPLGLLFRVEGDREAYAADLDDLSQVVDYDITPIDEGAFYIYIRDMSTPTTTQLVETFTCGSLLVVTPIKYLQNGKLTITVVGPASEIQAAVEGVPTGVQTEIVEVGGGEMSQAAVATRLSDRQHAAIVAGLNVGYYEIPRQATHADVAAAMGVRPVPPRNTSERQNLNLCEGCSRTTLVEMASNRREAVRFRTRHNNVSEVRQVNSSCMTFCEI